MRTSTPVLLSAAWLLLAVPAPAAPPAATTPLDAALAPKPYDPKPFEQGLRPYYRTRLKQRLGVSSLGDLPLIQLDVELNAVLGTLKIQQHILFQNPWPKPLRELVLRVYPNAAHLVGDGARNLVVESASVNGRPVEVRETSPTVLRIPLPAPLARGERVRLSLRTQTVVPRLPDSAVTSLGGMDPSAVLSGTSGGGGGYGIFGTTGGVFNLGFFYPILPARTDGAWDEIEPAGLGDSAHFDPANYLVKLKVPNAMTVAASGISLGEIPLGPGPQDPKEVSLLGTALRSFALQLSTRYETKERTVDGVRVRLSYLADNAEHADEILNCAAEAVRIYEKLFGPYPYPELDVAEAPLTGGAGGMEYPGMVTVALALTSGGTADPMGMLMQQMVKQTRTLEFTVAHEVAHQWFHALVGSDSNRHPFLDEAPANFAAVLYFEARHGQPRAAEQIQLELAMPFQIYRMLGGADGVVDRPTSAFRDPLEYSAMVYGKGAMFFVALRKLVGRAAMLKGLRAYAAAHSFRQAEPHELRDALAKAAGAKGKEVRALYKRWIEERHGDEDIGQVDLQTAMQQVMQQVQQLQGGGGGIDPAVFKAFQQAVQQMGGP